MDAGFKFCRSMRRRLCTRQLSFSVGVDELRQAGQDTLQTKGVRVAGAIRACAVQEVESGVSGRLAEVLLKHPAQTIPAQYRSALRGCCRCRLPRRALAQALVGPRFLVVLDELLQHVLEVAATKDQQMVMIASTPAGLAALDRAARHRSLRSGLPGGRQPARHPLRPSPDRRRATAAASVRWPEKVTAHLAWT